MKIKIFCVRTLLFFSLIGLAVIVVVISERQDQKELKKQQKETTRLEEQFKQDVDRAKRATADPCAMVPFEFVKPPVGLSGATKFVMFGEEISPDVDSSIFQFRPFRDRVELWSWVPRVGGGFYPAFNRIGEKYLLDSKFCRERKTHVGTEF